MRFCIFFYHQKEFLLYNQVSDSWAFCGANRNVVGSVLSPCTCPSIGAGTRAEPQQPCYLNLLDRRSALACPALHSVYRGINVHTAIPTTTQRQRHTVYGKEDKKRKIKVRESEEGRERESEHRCTRIRSIVCVVAGDQVSSTICVTWTVGLSTWGDTHCLEELLFQDRSAQPTINPTYTL